MKDFTGIELIGVRFAHLIALFDGTYVGDFARWSRASWKAAEVYGNR